MRRHGRQLGGKPVKVLADGRTEIDLAFVGERHQGGGRVHLGHRRERECDVRRERLACFDVGDAERLQVHDLVLFDDGDDGARRLGLIEFGGDDPRQFGEPILRRDRWPAEQQCDDRNNAETKGETPPAAAS
jgi:hypothetical protein